MRVLHGLLLIVTQVWTVNANVEKTIFLGPSPIVLPNVRPNLGDLRLHTLTPAQTILPTQLPVQFPSESAPRGLESWYLLHHLEAGRRYEVRICWPATVSTVALSSRDTSCRPSFKLLTFHFAHNHVPNANVPQQPTDFWLETYTTTRVFDTPERITSLAQYSEQEQVSSDPKEIRHDPAEPQSVLFLRVQAAASYYSTNRTLMEHPELVDVDISRSAHVSTVRIC
jgi:hypothetical protein